MKKILKAFERYKKEQNLPSTSYLYLEAAKKASPEIRKRPNQRQEVQTAQDPKHLTVHMTQGKLPHSQEEVPARPQAMVPSPKQMDALKSKDRVQSNKKPLTPDQKQPDDSLQEFLPLYNEDTIDKNLISLHLYSPLPGFS